MNNPLHHTALLLRTILVILVVVTQVLIPAGATPLTCPVSCQHEIETSDECAGCCESRGQDCAGDTEKSAGTNTQSREGQTSCGLYGCHFCAFVMLVDMDRSPAPQPLTALFFPPASLGDPANLQPPPPDHPPC